VHPDDRKRNGPENFGIAAAREILSSTSFGYISVGPTGILAIPVTPDRAARQRRDEAAGRVH
jgi:hypothetical protein